MNKKYIFVSIIALAIIASGIFYFLYRQQQTLPTKISGTTLNGVLVKNGWAKTSESYCAQGNDYFTLKTNNDELVLEFRPVYSEEQMSNFAGKNVTVKGKKEIKKIECPPESQCLGNVFTCEVFRIDTIKQR